MIKPLFNGTLPIVGTEVAKDWDLLYWSMTVLSAFFLVLVVGAMIYFAIAYRERPGHQSKYITHHNALEVIWTVIPTFLVLGIFAWGWIVYKKMVHAPGDAYEIRVVGKQWLWQFMYPNGRTLTNEVFVPVRKPVKFVMTSNDVLHSFFIPDFRVKQDAVPGMYTSVWFEALKPGEHVVFCAEYCGTAHSNMLAKVIVLDDPEWEAFQRGKEVESPGADPLAKAGKKLTQAKGCIACHTADGSKGIGPSYKGLYGSMREFSDGSKQLADDNYIRQSIENPQGKKVAGYQDIVMPPYPGPLTEEEFTALLAYFKSLK